MEKTEAEKRKQRAERFGITNPKVKYLIKH